MQFLFSATLFVSAFLLFWMQLMVAKMILPLLGGSPAVWNTCVFFFQTVLLLGYGYAHLITTVWKPRTQAIAHSVALCLPLPFLPIALVPGWTLPADANPILWLLVLLTLSVGIPFLRTSTTAPLVQKWFAYTGQAGSKDPYFLYAASNLGSLLGLLCYPLVIEPNISLTQQCWLWSGGYGVLLLLLLGCAVSVGRSPHAQSALAEPVSSSASSSDASPAIAQQGRWVLLSFLPSSLLLGVTTYLTTDLAAVPLLWAVPLAIYLLTFIIAFSSQSAERDLSEDISDDTYPDALVTWLPLLGATLLLLIVLRIVQPIGVVLPLHLLGLLVMALVFHRRLAQERPDPRYLTLFYFWIAVGGVLGGVFNAIAAPLLFSSILEYPLILLIGLVLLQTPSFTGAYGGGLRLSLTLPLGLSILGGGLLIGLDLSGWLQNLLCFAIALGLLLTLRYAFQLRTFNLVVGMLLIVLLTQFSNQGRGDVLTSDRSFFGVYRVVSSSQNGGYHSLLHGTTLHGKQSLQPERRDEPLTYFAKTGPVGQLFASMEAAPPSRVGVLGLGVGTLAAYAAPNQTWTFYEIDPLAQRLALNPDYFTFLRDAQVPPNIVLGDGRLAIAKVPDHAYDLLFMDAFSSDSIPVHLITQEAVQLYFDKLTERGILAINITNRYLNLEPVLGALAQHLELATLEQHEATISEEERSRGKAPSHWVLLSKQSQSFGHLLTDARWHPIPSVTNTVPWTDDFSNIVRAIRGLGVAP